MFQCDFPSIWGRFPAHFWSPNGEKIDSKSILKILRFYLRPSWQDVATKMPKMSQGKRTWEQNGWLKLRLRSRGHRQMCQQGEGGSHSLEPGNGFGARTLSHAMRQSSGLARRIEHASRNDRRSTI